jgi:hypothetical protein
VQAVPAQARTRILAAGEPFDAVTVPLMPPLDAPAAPGKNTARSATALNMAAIRAIEGRLITASPSHVCERSMSR